MNFSKHRAINCALFVLALLSAGCSTTFWGVEYPAFWEKYTSFDTMTVSPPRNDTRLQGAEYVVAEKFVSYLRNNAPYKIDSYVDASKNPENIDAIYNYAINRNPNANNAFVEIRLTSTDSSHDVEEKIEEIPHYVRDANGDIVYENGREKIDHIERRRYLVVTNTATAYGRVDISSPNNDVNHYSTRTGYCRDVDSPHRVYSIDYLMDCALNDLGLELAQAVTPHSRRMSIDYDDFRITAYNSKKSKYIDTKKFSASDEKLYVIVRLPKAARLNKFKVTIEARVNKKDVVLDTQSFVFDGSNPKTFTYDIAAVSALADTKDFTFRLSIGNTSITTRDITIKK